MHRGTEKLKRLGLPLFIIALPIMVVVGCSLESPEAPTWDAELSVPLIYKHYDMYELIDRMAEDALSYDSAGNLSISFEQEFDTVQIDAGLAADNVTRNFNHELGDITINSPDPLAVEMGIADYLDITAGVVPDVGFDANKDFAAISEYSSATFSGGFMVLQVTNNFGLQIDSLTVWIVDNITADTLAESIFAGGLEIGEIGTDTIYLQGKSTSNQLNLSSRIHTPGGTLLTVDDKYLGVDLTFSDQVMVSSAVTMVPSQEKSYTSAIELNEEHELTAALVSEGNISIDIENTSELGASLVITIDEIKSGSDPLVLNATIPGKGSYQINRDLTNYSLEPDLGENSMAFNVELDFSLPGSGSSMATITNSDKFSVEASLESLQFSQVSGVLAPTVVEIDPVVESVDLPKGMEDIRLSDAVVTMQVYSEVEFPTDLTVVLSGDAGQELSFERSINGGTPGNPGVTQITIQDISSLTNPVPSQITITGQALTGDGVTSGTLSSNSKVWGQVEITSPLKFAIGETLIEGDINSTEIDQDDIDEVSERLLNGTIYATLKNHLPFGCTVELYLGGDTATLYSNPQLLIGPIEVGAGVVEASGLVTSEEISDVVINLSETDLDIIENPVLYIGQKINLPGTNGQVVNIINTDYLDIEAYIRLNTRLGGEWD